jgi:hypothetical protein
MKKNYILKSLLGIILLAPAFVKAQSYVHQVIIVNEGQYDYFGGTQITPVTVSAYNPVSKNYSVFDTIQDARFASDVTTDDNFIYVAADSFLIAYDKNNYQVVRTKVIPGIRKIALWNNQLLVSRGNLESFNSYFQAYDKDSFTKLYELDTIAGPKYSTEGIVVINDTAYIAINNGFSWGNYVGKIGIIDLNNQQYKDEVDLGNDGMNPDNLMYDGGKIFTLNNKDWSGSSVSSFDPSTRSTQTVNLAISTGCGTSVKASDYIYYQESGSDKVARFSTNTLTTYDSLPLSKSFYGMLTDTLNNLIYATSTDYVTYGKAYIMTYNGALSDSFNVGVSPGNMALDVRNLLGVKEPGKTFMKTYPNPVLNQLNIISNQVQLISSLKIYDITGRVVYTKNNFVLNNVHQLDLSVLKPGSYFLKMSSQGEEINTKIIKN